MEISLNFKLQNSDFLAYHLYASSKSKNQNRQRLMVRILVPAFYFLLYLTLFLRYGIRVIDLWLVLFAISWLAFYPLYSKWKYKRHFLKTVEENYQNRINQPISIRLEEDQIFIKDFTSESTIETSAIKELIETKDHFFIKLKTEISLIIPKEAIENHSEFKDRLALFGAQYIDELNWKWD